MDKRSKRPRSASDLSIGPRMRDGKFYSGTAARRGKWAQMKFSKVQPWETYGAMRVARGTAENLERFGPSFKEASGAQRFARKSTGYTGRGKYGMKTLGKAYRAVTSRPFVKGFKRGVGAGADLLSALTPLQPELAPFAAAGEGISAMIGRGMYTPKSHGMNDLIRGGASSVPTVQSVDDETGSLIVSHTERVADIIAPSDDKFHVQSFTVQAGLEETFPWLHQLAACYEEYEMMQCVFEYRGHEIVGIQNTLDLQGQVIAATKYNVKSRSFTDRHEMQSYPHSASCSLNGTLQSGVEAHPSKIAAGDTHRYIRTGGLTSTEEASDYDHARFELALNNTPTDLFDKEVGQLFVYYTVKLSKPRLFAGRGKAITTYKQFSNSVQESYPFGGPTADASQAKVASRNTLQMTYTAPANNPKWTFPAGATGRFKCTFEVQGTNMEVGDFDFNGAPDLQGNVTFVKNFPGISGAQFGTYFYSLEGIPSSGTRSMVTFEVDVRPQTGSVKNSIGFTGMQFNMPGDTVARSAVTIHEINDYDLDSTGIPEVIGAVDGLVKVLD